MNPIIKLCNYDLDIAVDKEFAKDIRIGDILCVYDFETKEKPEWVLEFIGNEYDDTKDVFPVDEDYREENCYFKLKVIEREFRDNQLIFWVEIWSNVQIDFK